jgi:general secretion pathway protein N
MSARRLALMFAIVFVILLVGLFPLRLALGVMSAPAAGLSATSVRGSVWSGVLSGATLGGVRLGEVRAGLDLLGLFRGGGRIWFRTLGPVEAHGVVRPGAAVFGVEGLDAVLPSSLLAPAAPVEGRLQFTDVTAVFRHGDCRQAGGKVRLSDVAFGPVGGLVLQGEVRCEGRRLLLPLEGQGQGVALRVRLAVDGQGRYEAETLIRSSDANLAAAGAPPGERTLEGYRRLDRGRFGGG